MPPRGWSKKESKIKEPLTKEINTEEKIPKIIIEKTVKSSVKKVPDELGEQMKSVPNDQFRAKVLIVWRDIKGKQHTTQYIMSEDFELRENITEQFTASGYKKSFLHINLDGTVLEKTF